MILAAGCTPDHYERSADLATDRILRDREQETLGYKPQVEAKVETSGEATKKAYEKLPVTAVAPPAGTSIDRMKAESLGAPLGPEKFDYDPNTPLDLIPQEMTQFRNGSGPLGPDAPNSEVQRMDLFQAIEYAVQHARPYQNKMEDIYLATLDVTLQRHMFEPRPFMTTGYTFDGGQRDANYRSALTATNAVGVKQQLPYGGEIVAQQLVTAVDALNAQTNDGQAAGVALSASVPLLRGAGLINLESLINSERGLVYIVRDFETYRRSFVVDIASQYFALINQQQQIANRVRNYGNLRNLTERTQALFQAGKLGFLDVQRSFQNQLNSENDLIKSISSYQNLLDDFKVSLGMDVTAELVVVPVELAMDVPSHTDAEATELALRYRLDLQTSKDRIEDSRRGIANARNGLLPDLNLIAATSGGSAADSAVPLGADPGSMWRWSGDSILYSAGMRLDWPLDRVKERNVYRASLIGLERAQRSFVTVKETVIADVRQDTRSIRVAAATLRIQQRSLDLARKRLDLANELLNQGKTGALDVVDAETALVAAQDGYNGAKANMQTLILQYLRDTGTLRIDPQSGLLGRAMDRAGSQLRAIEGDVGANGTSSGR
jgi:hypothetical protein